MTEYRVNILETLKATSPAFSAEHADVLLRLGHVKHLTKKEYLIRQGEICNFIAIAINGCLRSFITKEAKELNNDFYLENDFVCAYTSYLTDQPTNCNIQALEDVTLLMISKARFEQLINSELLWLKLGKYISDSYFKRKCRRETSFLRMDANERYESFLKMYPQIEQRVAQYHIASYLGIEPESLSRIKLAAYAYRQIGEL